MMMIIHVIIHVITSSESDQPGSQLGFAPSPRTCMWSWIWLPIISFSPSQVCGHADHPQPSCTAKRCETVQFTDCQSVNCECKSRVAVPRFPSTGIVILLGLARRTSQQIEKVSLFYRHVGNLVVDEPCPVRTVIAEIVWAQIPTTTNRGLGLPAAEACQQRGVAAVLSRHV